MDRVAGSRGAGGHPRTGGALEHVLAIMDRLSDGVTVRDLIARIECEADKETIRLLRLELALSSD